MFIDLSILVSSSSSKTAAENEKMTSFGHHGTHFDVMNKEFPQKFIRLAGLVFNIRGISGRDTIYWILTLNWLNRARLSP
jgi:hypothetical protein